MFKGLIKLFENEKSPLLMWVSEIGVHPFGQHNEVGYKLLVLVSEMSIITFLANTNGYIVLVSKMGIMFIWPKHYLMDTTSIMLVCENYLHLTNMLEEV